MYVTIHGHFYQPPRENPWTGEIPRQESAAPYHDWNARITDECYGPNSRSRVLGAGGRITAIVNNYAHLSFDFGPTLLFDLERRFPAVYRRIQEADRDSRARHGGHGNGMAQAYNHMILPLANSLDKRTQVRWGLRDFEHRFGRPSEGLWLPETACDRETLQVVVEAGVRFLLLAPHQALRVRNLGGTAWQDARNGAIDTSRPYRCLVTDRASQVRPIDVFFYDGSLSVAVSFEHLLRRAEGFVERLHAAGRRLSERGLVHVATDGEVYGHHEPFGDMCLAYVFKSEGARRGLWFVNYGEMLDLNPPEQEVELNFTDSGEGTAWSCAHGVGRWVRDCGCSTGGQPGWNQRWRTPLRRGLDAIRDEIQRAYATTAGLHLIDPWAARDDYIEVLLDPSEGSRGAFLRRHLRGSVDSSTRRMIWSLLEATHQALLMYTSCAWFFADISGLEVQQNLAYAARAIELAQPFLTTPLEPLLLRYLEQARSNRPEWRHGARVYRELVLSRRLGPEHAAARSAIEASVLGRSLNRRIHRYAIKGTTDCAGDGTDCTGQLRVSDPAVEQSWSWGFRVSGGALGRKEVQLQPALDREASVPALQATFRLRDFDRDVREELAHSALRRSLLEEDDRIRDIYAEAHGPIGLLLDLELPVPEIYQALGKYVLNQRLWEMAGAVGDGPEHLPSDFWTQAQANLDEARLLGIDADAGPLAAKLSERIQALLNLAAEESADQASLDRVAAAYATVVQADRLKLPFQRGGFEAATYDLVQRFRQDLAKRSGARKPDAAPAGSADASEPEDGLEALGLLAGHANLQLDAILREESPPARERPVVTSMGGVTRDAEG